MKTHVPYERTPWQELQLVFERVKIAAAEAGLDYDGFHELTDDTWCHLYHRAYSAARRLDQTADLYRFKWRSHALERIAQHKQRNERKNK